MLTFILQCVNLIVETKKKSNQVKLILNFSHFDIRIAFIPFVCVCDLLRCFMTFRRIITCFDLDWSNRESLNAKKSMLNGMRWHHQKKNKWTWVWIGQIDNCVCVDTTVDFVDFICLNKRVYLLICWHLLCSFSKYDYDVLWTFSIGWTDFFATHFFNWYPLKFATE